MGSGIANGIVNGVASGVVNRVRVDGVGNVVERNRVRNCAITWMNSGRAGE